MKCPDDIFHSAVARCIIWNITQDLQTFISLQYKVQTIFNNVVKQSDNKNIIIILNIIKQSTYIHLKILLKFCLESWMIRG